jgi:hypothetical protein
VASTIKIKRSGVLNKTPTTSDIATGELAINYKDQKLYSSNGTAVFQIGASAGGANASYLQVANAVATYLTKNNPVVTGTLTANNSTGTAGYYLRTSGSGVYWSPASSNGGSTTQYLQVANAVATYATKVSPTTSGLLAHTGRATISTNLYVAGNTILGNPATVTDRTIINGVTVANGQLSVVGNTVISGTLVANSTAGVSGYYLRTSGTGVYWSPVSASGGGSNSFSGILVGANVVSADSTTDRLTLVAGSGISLAANPTTDTITIATTSASSATGGGTDKAFYENDTTITTNYTITTDKNAMTAGPVTINSGVTVTIPSGSVWSII